MSFPCVLQVTLLYFYFVVFCEAPSFHDWVPLQKATKKSALNHSHTKRVLSVWSWKSVVLDNVGLFSHKPLQFNSICNQFPTQSSVFSECCPNCLSALLGDWLSRRFLLPLFIWYPTNFCLSTTFPLSFYTKKWAFAKKVSLCKKSEKKNQGRPPFRVEKFFLPRKRVLDCAIWRTIFGDYTI